MALKVLFFAQAAEWMGRRELELPLERPARLEELCALSALAPLRPHLRYLQVAVNHEYAQWSAEVHDGDEVAVLPPVSGG